MLETSPVQPAPFMVDNGFGGTPLVQGRRRPTPQGVHLADSMPMGKPATRENSFSALSIGDVHGLNTKKTDMPWGTGPEIRQTKRRSVTGANASL